MIRRSLERLTEVSNDMDVTIDRFLSEMVGAGLFSGVSNACDTAKFLLSSLLGTPVELARSVKGERTYGLLVIETVEHVMGQYDPACFVNTDPFILYRNFFKKCASSEYE